MSTVQVALAYGCLSCAARAKELVGPVYTTYQKEQINHFKEVVMHAEMIRNLQVRFSFF